MPADREYTYYIGAAPWSPPYSQLLPLTSHRQDVFELIPTEISAKATIQIKQSNDFFVQFDKTVDEQIGTCDLADPICSEEFRVRAYQALAAGTHRITTTLKRGDFLLIDTFEEGENSRVQVRKWASTGLVEIVAEFRLDLDLSHLVVPGVLQPAQNYPFPVLHYAYVRDANCLRNPNCRFALQFPQQSTESPHWFAKVLDGLWESIGPATAYAQERCREPTVVVFAIPGGGVRHGQIGDIAAWSHMVNNNPLLNGYRVEFEPLWYSGDTRIEDAANLLRPKIVSKMQGYGEDDRFIIVANCQGAVVAWKILNQAIEQGLRPFPLEQYAGFLSFELPLAGGWAPNARPLQQLWWWMDFLNVTYLNSPQAEDMYYQSPLLLEIEGHEEPQELRILRRNGMGGYIYHKDRGDRISPPGGYQTYDHTPWERPNYIENQRILADLKLVVTGMVMSAVLDRHCPVAAEEDPPTMCNSGECEEPTATPTATPTSTPTPTPTPTATSTPTPVTTASATPTPTPTPTPMPTNTPTPTPTPLVTNTSTPTPTAGHGGGGGSGGGGGEPCSGVIDEYHPCY